MSRLRIKLARLLEIELRAMLDDRVTVDPSTLYPATGWFRTSPQADCYRWEGFFKHGTQTCSVDSWDTMTDCCKHGVTVHMDGRHYAFEASARQPTNGS